MKKFFLIIGLIVFTTHFIAAQCSCRSNIVVGIDYRDNLNNPISGGVPAFTPSTLASAQSVGNKVALYIYTAPCGPTQSTPCYGRLKAILTKGNGTTVPTPFYSTGGWSASYSEILVPVSNFTVGINSFQVFGECNNGNTFPTSCPTSNTPQVLVSGGTSNNCVNFTITPNCDFWTYVAPGNPHTFGGYTGDIYFMINSTVPAGCTSPVSIRLTKPDATSISAGFFSTIQLPSSYPFNTAMNGVYTIEFLDAFGSVISSYTFNKSASTCPVTLPCNSDVVLIDNYLYQDNTQTYPTPIVQPLNFTTPLTQSSSFILTSNIIIPAGATVKLDADPINGYIELFADFEAQTGSVFIAQCLDGCGSGVPMRLTPPDEAPTNGDTYTIANHSDFNIYPNPTNGQITVQHTPDIGAIRIFDILGKQVLQTATTDAETHIDLSELPNGIYFLQINGQQTQKIIKQ